jgi:hypothetical protein
MLLEQTLYGASFFLYHFDYFFTFVVRYLHRKKTNGRRFSHRRVRRIASVFVSIRVIKTTTVLLPSN